MSSHFIRKVAVRSVFFCCFSFLALRFVVEKRKGVLHFLVNFRTFGFRGAPHAGKDEELGCTEKQTLRLRRLWRSFALYHVLFCFVFFPSFTFCGRVLASFP